MATSVAPSLQDELIEAAARFYGDPLNFVLYAYPWGEPGPLRDHSGPDKWQESVLRQVGEQIRAHKGKTPPFLPIRQAIASGHGIGKTTLVAWLVDYVMVCHPFTQGTVTANTFDQLETKTWAAIQRWTALCIFSDWFEVNSRMMYAKGHKASWFVAAQSSKEENSEAFAGQHSEQGSSVYFFDEASAIPDKIAEVAEGGLTDGEPMIFLFGNATRNTGFFHAACFGTGRDRWKPVSVDSRDSRFTNKELIAEWIETYGEDSDFVRVRVRGLPPRASELQFIDQERVWQAQKRPLPVVFEDEPLIAGVDVSDGGSAWNVVRFRRGADARSIPPVRIPGEAVRHDRSGFTAKLADILSGGVQGKQVHTMFFDSAFGAPYAVRLQGMGFKNVVEVRFGGDSPDRHQANMRAYMWNRMKEWLGTGAIDPKDERLEIDLTGPGYKINTSDKLVLESKADMMKRGVASPDDGDALALTFSAVVRPKKAQANVGHVTADWQWA
jgi:hypothetical protein